MNARQRAVVADLRRMIVLENSAKMLQRHVDRMSNALDARAAMHNSFPAFIQAAYPTTEMASVNNLTGYNAYTPLTLNWQTIMYAYKTHGILQAAVDMPVEDALRGGLDFHSDEAGEDIKQLEDFLERSSFYHVIKTGKIWANLFGGAAYLINTEGNADTEKPLRPEDIAGQKLEIYPASRWEIQSTSRWADYYTFYGQRFHKSRVKTITGKEAPFQIRWMLQDWGLSDFEKLLEPFNVYLRAEAAIYDLLKEAKVDVYSWDGFDTLMSSQKGTEMAIQRVQAVNQSKSTGNAIVMSTKDKYEQKQVTFSGLAEMKKENRIGLASALRIPMTKLFGLSASGFNSGEDDIENYNAMVESKEREALRPILREMLELVSYSVFGDNFDIQFEFKPLRVLGSDAEEQIKASKHNRYSSLYQAGILDAQEYAQLLHKEKMLPVECKVMNGAEPEPPAMAQMGMEGGPGGAEGGDKGKDEGKEGSQGKTGAAKPGKGKEGKDGEPAENAVGLQ